VAGEVLIRISAASVNPVDWKMRMSQGLPMKFPVVQGADASGIVVALGAGVSAFKCGDAVVAYAFHTQYSRNIGGAARSSSPRSHLAKSRGLQIRSANRSSAANTS